jgi:1-acyl-sn-glycerol-3-phosphate acyltransferase
MSFLLNASGTNVNPVKMWRLWGKVALLSMKTIRKLGFYIRMGLIALWFWTACVIAMAMLPFRWRDPSLGTLFSRLLAFGSHIILGVRIRVEGESKLYTSQPCVYVPNHQNNFDIVTMSTLFPYRTVVIGKKQLKWIPLFGLFFPGTGMIMIDRQNRTHAVAGLEQARESIQEKGHSVWIFPEGTRNHGSAELLPFKKGAFHIAIAAQVPIVPIVQQHLFRYYDPSIPALTSGKRDIVVRVLDPIPTVGMTTKDVPRLMELVRRQMQEELRTPELCAPGPRNLSEAMLETRGTQS